MNKPGNLDSQSENRTDSLEVANTSRRTLPWKIVILGAVALLLAVMVGTQVLGVLYVILFPPKPPLPPDVTLKTHSSDDYGVDEWVYTSQQDACNVLTFYMNSGECRIAPFQCSDVRTDDKSLSGAGTFGQHIARCVGEAKASIFAMRWEAIIATGPSAEVPAEFRLTREVFWTGQVPPLTQPDQP